MSRNSIPNVNPDVNSNSGFSIAGSDVSEDPSEASHPDRVVDGDSTGPESKQEYGHSPETPIRNDGSLLSPNLHSNSLDSGGGGGSFDRKKKKPLFQRMLEKAREEDRDHSKHEKPLFQRILEKAQVDSDLEEKIKVFESFFLFCGSYINIVTLDFFSDCSFIDSFLKMAYLTCLLIDNSADKNRMIK